MIELKKKCKLLKQKINKNKKDTPHDILISVINDQKQKELERDIWSQSDFRDINELQSNNVGNVGENFINEICRSNEISANINGSTTKIKGGGNGDGKIKGENVEIKTAHQGTSGTFQHELGEHPWRPEYLVFLDVAPNSFFLTIIENFTEIHYKCGNKCDPYFPTKSITQRKKTGNFKFDTSINLNRKSKATLEITKETTIKQIGDFINLMIV